MKIFIAGDIYPGEASAGILASRSVDSLFGSLAGILKDADLTVANLEGPVGRPVNPVPKIGPSHEIPVGCLDGIKSLGISLLTLANNHIMDSGIEGLNRTILECERRGIATCGAGATVSEASQAKVMLVGGLRVAILSMTEHEFGFATGNRGGSNPLDPINFVRGVQSCRGQWDKLIVLLHAGTEYDPYPRPELVKVCRFMVEQGADLVVCQQPHCAGCVESYRAGHIVYGQGYFLFDELRSREGTQEGFVIRYEVSSAESSELKFIPYRHSPGSPGPVQMCEKESDLFVKRLLERSECLKSDAALQEKWADYCRRNSRRYLALVQGYGRTVRRIDQKLDILRHFYKTGHLRMLLHLFRCETHREAIIKILSDSVRA